MVEEEKLNEKQDEDMLKGVDLEQVRSEEERQVGNDEENNEKQEEADDEELKEKIDMDEAAELPGTQPDGPNDKIDSSELYEGGQPGKQSNTIRLYFRNLKQLYRTFRLEEPNLRYLNFIYLDLDLKMTRVETLTSDDIELLKAL